MLSNRSCAVNLPQSMPQLCEHHTCWWNRATWWWRKTDHDHFIWVDCMCTNNCRLRAALLPPPVKETIFPGAARCQDEKQFTVTYGTVQTLRAFVHLRAYHKGITLNKCHVFS